MTEQPEWNPNKKELVSSIADLVMESLCAADVPGPFPMVRCPACRKLYFRFERALFSRHMTYRHSKDVLLNCYFSLIMLGDQGTDL